MKKSLILTLLLVGSVFSQDASMGDNSTSGTSSESGGIDLTQFYDWIDA